MTLLTNVFDGQSLFRSVEALAGSDALLSSTGLAPTLAELELANLPPLASDNDTAQAVAGDGEAAGIADAVAAAASTANGATATVTPAAQAVGGDALAAAAAAVSVDGGALPLDADLAAAALLGPTSAVAVAADATIGSGSSAIDVAAAAVLGTGTLGSSVPILGNLLGGTGDGTGPVGHLPLVSDLLGGTGLGSGGLLGGLPVVGDLLGGTGLGGVTNGLPVLGDLLGQGPGEGLLDNGVPVVGNLLENLGNGLAGANAPGEGPLVAEVLNLPLELLGLNGSTGNLEGVLHDTGVVVAGAGTLVDALGENVGNALSQPLAVTANDVVADVHAFLEIVGHEVALNGAIHGVTELGNTIGLGEIGGDNLVTDVLEVPGVLLGGGDLGAQLGDINTDIGNILTGIPPIVTGAVLDLNDGTYGVDLTGQNGIVADLTGALSGTSTSSLPILGGLGDSLAIPSLGGAGADALVGTLADSVQGVIVVAEQPLASLDLGLGELLGLPADQHLPDATGQDQHGPLGLGLI